MSDVDSLARQRSQERAQKYAADTARQVATDAASKVSGDVGRRRAFTRTYNASFPVLYDQVIEKYRREEYARLLVEGST